MRIRASARTCDVFSSFCHTPRARPMSRRMRLAGSVGSAGAADGGRTSGCSGLMPASFPPKPKTMPPELVPYEPFFNAIKNAIIRTKQVCKRLPESDVTVNNVSGALAAFAKTAKLDPDCVSTAALLEPVYNFDHCSRLFDQAGALASHPGAADLVAKAGYHVICAMRTLIGVTNGAHRPAVARQQEPEAWHPRPGDMTEFVGHVDRTAGVPPTGGLFHVMSTEPAPLRGWATELVGMAPKVEPRPMGGSMQWRDDKGTPIDGWNQY
jgi:hypothetical protein